MREKEYFPRSANENGFECTKVNSVAFTNVCERGNAETYFSNFILTKIAVEMDNVH